MSALVETAAWLAALCAALLAALGLLRGGSSALFDGEDRNVVAQLHFHLVDDAIHERGRRRLRGHELFELPPQRFGLLFGVKHFLLLDERQTTGAVRINMVLMTAVLL